MNGTPYLQHFGLAVEPFSLSPDPDFLYASPAHAEALAGLELALRGRRGLTTLVGEVGTGKTTLLYTLLRDLDATVHTAYLANTRLGFVDLLRLALADFGVPTPGRSRLALLEALQGFLRRCDAEGAIAALVVDEAQNLDADTFEQLRLLTNYETYASKLLQIVLVGQPELAATLARPELRQVNERIAHRCILRPLSPREARRYLAHRVSRAGGAPGLFTPAAQAVLLGASRGVPRRLNVLAHTALLFAFGRGAARVAGRDAWAALRERRRGAAAARTSLRRAGAWAAAAGVVAIAGAAAAVGRFSAAPRPLVAAAPTAAALAAVAAAPAAAPAAPPPAFIVVGKGQTLTDIARRQYGNAKPETLRKLRAANPNLKDPDRITAGDVLRLPGVG